MKILSKIVAAEEDEVVRVGESLSPQDEWSILDWPALDTDKVVMLHCLLTGEQLGDAFGFYQPIYLADTGATILRIAATVQEGVAVLEEANLELLAEELAVSEPFEAESWQVSDVHSLLGDLAELARLAESQGQILLLWMCQQQD